MTFPVLKQSPVTRVIPITRHSGRKVGKKRRCHLGSEFLKEPTRLRDVPISEVNNREIEGEKAPVWHHLDELACANEFGLHDRR